MGADDTAIDGRRAGRVADWLERLAGPVAGVGADEESAKLAWLVRLRWVAGAGQLAVVGPALSLGWLERRFLVCYLGTWTGLLLFNLWTTRRLRRRVSPTGDEMLVQLLVDMLALTLLLLLSGGAWNPLSPIMFIHAGLAALLLSGARSWLAVVALFGVAATISLAPLLPPALPDPPTPSALVLLPSQLLVALVLWALTAWLGRSLESHRRILLNLQEQQTRADRLRAAGALAAGFSHEFATPLNTVRMRLDRLGRRLPDEDPDLDAARDAAARCEEVLHRMVGGSLDPAKTRIERVDLAALVGRACGSWSGPGRRAGVRLGDQPLPRCTIPPLAFTQALLNLLDNAAEAMEEAGAAPPVEVEVEVSGSPEHVEVAVLDRGPGWPEVVRRHQGQPFVTTRPGGNGLGLYNAHTLAVALGGRLHLEDRPGGGAIARFSLPIGDAAGTQGVP